MEGPSFSKVLNIRKWSCLHFQASFLVDLPFGCPLRQFKGAPSLPSICICYFPLPALLLTFLPPHNSSEPNRRCSREIQAAKDAKHRPSCPTLPRSKLPVQTDFSSPYHKPLTFFPNLSHSIHHMVACCYDNEGLSWVVLSFWWLPKGEIILLKICLRFYATHGRSTTYSLHLHLDSLPTYQSTSFRCQS